MGKFRNLTRLSELAMNPESRLAIVVRVLATFQVALMAVTWPLWWGQPDFPQVPLISTGIAPANGSFLSVVLIFAASLIVVALGPLHDETRRARVPQWTSLVTGLLLVVLNQHRLQPWHWLFLLCQTWCVLFSPPHVLRLMRHTLCTIYACAALSRISATPQFGMTGVIVSRLLNRSHVVVLPMDESTLVFLCWLVTIAEFITGMLLLFRRTRSSGVVMALLLHLLLLLALGRLGLNHHSAVLLWNTSLLCVVPLCFVGKDLPSTHPSDDRTTISDWWLKFALITTWMFPLSALIGIADNWPGWQIYSPRPENWTCLIHEADRSQLPDFLRQYAGDPAPLSDWSPIRLEQWSLDATQAPLYPEDRFQMAIIEFVLSQLPPDCRFRVETSEPAPVFWWRRISHETDKLIELKKWRGRWLLNSEAFTNGGEAIPDPSRVFE